MRDLLSMALLYQKLGFSILPIYSIKNGICACQNPNCSSPGKHPIPYKGVFEATNDLDQIEKWWKSICIDANIAIRTGSISGICVLDIDPRNNGNDSFDLLERTYGKLPYTLESSTGGNGKHLFFEYDPRVSFNRNNFFQGIDFKSENGYVIVPPSNHISGTHYLWEDFSDPDTTPIRKMPEWLIEKLNEPKKIQALIRHDYIYEGTRNNYLTSIAGAMRRKGVGFKGILAALSEENKEKCNPPLHELELGTIAKSISKYKPAEKIENFNIADEAYIGPLGQIVNKISPHTESSKEALLLQLIAVLGNLYGNECYYQVESTKLYPNIFCVIVGKSSWARKGTSWNHIERLIKLSGPRALADEHWQEFGLRSGLSSGEGLLFHLRDKSEEDKENSDKRITIIESEFSSVLKKISRDGNVISQVIRDAWDSRNLSILTKTDPIHVSAPHISIIGHITQQELNKFLDGLEIFNGFANRFLWIYSIRSKLLPFGGDIEAILFEEEIKELLKGKTLSGRLSFDDMARSLWRRIYYELSEERSSEITENIAARGPAQILKLSLIYALSSNRKQIHTEDLLAAKSIWDFSEKTSAKIFAKKESNPLISKILNELTENQQQLTRTDISS